MREIDEIIVHCSATRPDWMAGQGVAAKRDEIRSWHVDGNGWRDIGYHVIIDRNGERASGRDFATIGAHAKGHNKNSIGICLIGGHGSSENDEFKHHYTPAQDASLRAEIESLKARYPKITRVTGHNEYAAKACPGFRVARWVDHKPSSRGTPLKSKELIAGAGAVTTGAGGVFTALAKLDPVAQAIVSVTALMAAVCVGYLMRKRLQRWARGVQ